MKRYYDYGNEIRVVVLTGGLGNQLFQLAMGMNYFREGNEILFDASWGNSKKNKSGLPEICEFQLPKKIKVSNNTKVLFVDKKIFNLTFRIGSSRSASTSTEFLLKFVSKKCLNYLRWRFARSSRVIAPKGTGFDETIISGISGDFLFGYFQSFLWASNVETLIELRKLKLLNENEWLKTLKSLAKLESPLIVHVRLGDYLEESNFGIPSDEYYDSAITLLWETGKYKKIWLFSDDPKNALNKLPSWTFEHIRIVDDGVASASSNLEAMRFGAGYVISNSTFSWWGAFLSKNLDSNVIAPFPWFKNQKEPNLLIPPGWLRVRAF